MTTHNQGLKTSVVVIPVHKENPTKYELISFQQCFRILGKWPIKLVVPEGLSLKAYHHVVEEFDVISVPAHWLSSLKSYNKLKISRYFYGLFSEYEYLLTYELDCFVFSDQLEAWCKKGYDYIGAPWFEGFSEPTSENFAGVGNSGFSLRKISTVNKILKSIFYRSPAKYQTGNINRIKATIQSPWYWLLNQSSENYTLQQYCDIPEDQFFCIVAPSYKYSFNIAPASDALQFSFEVAPSVLYRLNNKQLPMGCHAWWRYDTEFWKPFIEQFGYEL